MAISREASTAAGGAAVIDPASPDYDAARQVFSLTADLRPAAISIARSKEEVQAAVAYARSHDMRIAALSSGHIASALPPLDDTLLLRLALDDARETPGGVEIDVEGLTAHVPAGAVWGDVIDALAPHGLTAMHGSSRTVSVVGYLLGGGLSYYGRRHGLAANHVRSFEVVTVDGVERHVDATRHPDLFWALRGGGGSFGIVTSVEIELLPYADVHGGALTFAVKDAEQVVRGWRDWTRAAPTSVTSTLRMIAMPDLPVVPEPLRGTSIVMVDAIALDGRDGDELESHLRGSATPIGGGFGQMQAVAATRVHDDPEEPVPGVGAGGMLLRELDDAAIDAFLRVTGPGSGSPLAVAELRHLGGALRTAPEDAGVRGHLEGEFTTLAGGLPGLRLPRAHLVDHLDRYMGALSPWSTGTRFMSFAVKPGTTIEGIVPQESVERLTQVRAEYDPDRVLLAPHRVP